MGKVSSGVLGKFAATCKSMKSEHTLSPCTKINSKRLKDINIRHDTIKILAKSTGKTFSDLNVFLRLVSQANRNKSKDKQN